MMIACLKSNSPLDFTKYTNSDIDIYLVSKAPIFDIDVLLKKILSDFVESEICVIYHTNVLFEIVFANATRRKIKIIRQVRHEISAECGHDVDRVVDYYRSVEEQLKRSGRFRFAGYAARPESRQGAIGTSPVAVISSLEDPCPILSERTVTSPAPNP